MFRSRIIMAPLSLLTYYELNRYGRGIILERVSWTTQQRKSAIHGNSAGDTGWPKVRIPP